MRTFGRNQGGLTPAGEMLPARSCRWPILGGAGALARHPVLSSSTLELDSRARRWNFGAACATFAVVSRPASDLLAEAVGLPVAERLKLASALIASVDGTPDPDWDAAWVAELDRRVAAARARGAP